MLIDFQILAIELFFLTIAFLGVVAMRFYNQPANWIECVSTHVQFSAKSVVTGLGLAVERPVFLMRYKNSPALALYLKVQRMPSKDK